MAVANQVGVGVLDQIRCGLGAHGVIFLPSLAQGVPTPDIARELGSAVDAGAAKDWASCVQVLRPRSIREAPLNLYSGHFGLDEFPLHTDAALWVMPPRYFVLRCVVGSSDVMTTTLSVDVLVSELGMATLRRAVVCPRRASRNGSACAMPLLLEGGDLVSIRWDPLFLVPANQCARTVFAWMADRSRWAKHERKVSLAHPGDTLVVDNWRTLHGRSRVPDGAAQRVIERVYLACIKDQ